MGVLYDVYQSVKKKHCKMCGCNLDYKHDGDICECCLDDLYASDPGEEEKYD